MASTDEDIRDVYRSDIDRRTWIVGHSKSGWMQFYDGLKGMSVGSIYPTAFTREEVEELQKICAKDIRKVGVLPQK